MLCARVDGMFDVDGRTVFWWIKRSFIEVEALTFFSSSFRIAVRIWVHVYTSHVVTILRSRIHNR